MAKKTPKVYKRSNILAFILVFALLGGYFVIRSFAASPTCDVNVTTVSNAALIAGISSAQPGQTVCVASGDYGEIVNEMGLNKSSPGVTITAAPGATPRMSFTANDPSHPMSWLTFDNVTITGTNISSPANNITIKNSHMSGYNQLNPGYWGGPNGGNNGCSNCTDPMVNAAITFDNDLFDVSDCPTGSCLTYEGRLSIVDGQGTSAGITVKNSTFRDNCADGIQISSDDTGIIIGPGNVFTNLKQNSCGPHVDSIQPFGGHTIVTGNYFHDDETGIAQYDGGLGHNQYTNNVFQNIARTDETLLVTGEDSTTVEHNTVVAPDYIHFGQDHEGAAAMNIVVRNNVTETVDVTETGSTFTVNDYNLCASTCPGAHSITGSPAFVGGSSLTQHDAFLLTAGSPGHLAASDGTDMGISALGTGSGGGSVTGDLNGDGHVNIFDLSIFLSHWQQTGAGLPEDFNNDGVVNIFDLSILLSHYGT